MADTGWDADEAHRAGYLKVPRPLCQRCIKYGGSRAEADICTGGKRAADSSAGDHVCCFWKPSGERRPNAGNQKIILKRQMAIDEATPVEKIDRRRKRI